VLKCHKTLIIIQDYILLLLLLLGIFCLKWKFNKMSENSSTILLFFYFINTLNVLCRHKEVMDHAMMDMKTLNTKI